MRWLFILALLLTGCGQEDCPLGNSKISYLQKIRDGVLFSETFENDGFLSANGWTTLQGTPTNTSNQYKQGIKSFLNDTGDLPVIKKTLTVPSSLEQWMVSIWFYDDASNVTDEGPYFKIKTSDNKYFQLGVRNGVSTTKYSANDPSLTTQDNFAETVISRSTGWHELKIYKSNDTSVSVQIDSQNVYGGGAWVVLGGNYISEIYIQSNTVGGSGNSFGYFDALGYFVNANFWVYGAENKKTTFYYSSTRQVFYSVNFCAERQLFSYAYTNPPTLFPSQVYCFISKEGATSSSDELEIQEYASPLIQINPGDIYEYKTIDFDRRWTSLNTTPNSLQNNSSTAAGVQSTQLFALQNRNQFSMDQLEGTSWKKDAENFFYGYARQGNPFSIKTDEVTDIQFGVISRFTPSGNPRVSIYDNLSILATDNFSEGDVVYIQNRDNTNKQINTIASVDTNSSLTFEDVLQFDVNSGDYIFSQFWFPWEELDGQSLPGFRQVNAQNVRYSWDLPTRNYNGEI